MTTIGMPRERAERMADASRVARMAALSASKVTPRRKTKYQPIREPTGTMAAWAFLGFTFVVVTAGVLAWHYRDIWKGWLG